MSGRGKGGNVEGKSKSRSSRAGLQFPVGRLELAGNAARDNQKTRIIPRHLQLSIRNDEELIRLLSGVTIAQGGVLPNIQAFICRKKLIRRPKILEQRRRALPYKGSKCLLKGALICDISLNFIRVRDLTSNFRFYTVHVVTSLNVTPTPSMNLQTQRKST